MNVHAPALAKAHGFDEQTSAFARDVVDDLLLAVRPALEETGEADRVEAGVRQILREGTGARRQRLAYQRAQRFDDVIGLITGETATSVKSPLPMNQVPEGA